MNCRVVQTWANCWAIALLMLACASQDDGGSGAGGPTSGTGGTGGKTVGTSGGTVTQGGVTITVPPGAVPSDTPVTITPTTPPPGYALASAAYQFGPAGTTFAKPVTVAIPLTAPTPGAHLFWSNASGGFDDLGGTVSGSVLTGSVTHFSTGFCSVPSRDGGRDDASVDGATTGTGGQGGTTGTGGTSGGTGATSGAGGTIGSGGSGAVGGAGGGSSGAGGTAGVAAGGAGGTTGAGGLGGSGGAAGAGGAAGDDGGGAAGTAGSNTGGSGAGGNSGADASTDVGSAGGTAGAAGSAGGGTGGTGSDASSPDTSSPDTSWIDAAALCATTGLNLPAAKVAYVDSSAPPDGTSYAGGTMPSGKHYLTAVTHYGSGTYAGSKQAQYTFDPNAGTIQIGEFTSSGSVYIGMTYVPLDAHTLQATVVCDTGDGGSSSPLFYYTVSSTDQGTSLTLTSAGSSDVLTIGPP